MEISDVDLVDTSLIWIDLSPKWDIICTKAQERHLAKRNLDSHRRWVNNPDMPGLCVEVGFGIVRGTNPNYELLRGGDVGYDFHGGIDCKGTECEQPHLILELDDPLIADHYVLGIADIQNKRCRILGWASRTDVKERSFIKDWGHGGPKISIHHLMLRKLCPCCYRFIDRGFVCQTSGSNARYGTFEKVEV